MSTPRHHGNLAGDSDISPRARAAPAGFADELGERSLVFDPASESVVETLLLRREFAESAAFEGALRSRVARVGRLPHASLCRVQSVDRTADGLALVSTYPSGRRLSEFWSNDAGIAHAIEVIRSLTPALAAIQQAGSGSGHGALSPNRVVITRERRLILLEHVLAPALESLRWSRQRYAELGLVVGDAAPVRFDERTDLRQLGWMVLSLLLGREIPAGEYPLQARWFLDELIRTQPALAATGLTDWVGRALQIEPNAFASATEAAAVFDEFVDHTALATAEAEDALLAFPSESPAPAPLPVTRPIVPVANDLLLKPAKPVRANGSPAPAREPKLHAVPVPAAAHPPVKPAATPAPKPVVKPKVPSLAAAPVVQSSRALGWVAAIFAVVAVAEAAAIVLLLMQPRVVVPAPPPRESAPNVLPPLTLIDGALAGQPTTASAEPAPAPAPPPVAAPKPVPPARPSAFTVVAPINLDVMKDGALIGSSGGPITIAPGTYSLVFSNRTLGFRATQVVTVTTGQTAAVRVAIPEMPVSVNAVPWADVTIDGVAAGQTPLANVSLRIGSHEFVFRHPDLGERRQTVVVRADVPTRVTQTFR